MATKPTRQQQQAADHLAEALLLIAAAARLDVHAKPGPDAFREVAGRLAHVSLAFTLDEIVARALDRRGRALGLPASTAELLTLLDSDREPLDILLLADEEFKALVATVEEELGEV